MDKNNIGVSVVLFFLINGDNFCLFQNTIFRLNFRVPVRMFGNQRVTKTENRVLIRINIFRCSVQSSGKLLQSFINGGESPLAIKNQSAFSSQPIFFMLRYVRHFHGR